MRHFLSIFAILLTLFGLIACQRAPEGPPPPALPERITWDGQLAPAKDVDSSVWPRLHTLNFPGADSMRILLREYPADYQAFRAFQEKASREEIRQGYYREKNSLWFYHGPFLGEVRHGRGALLPAAFIKERLAFGAEEAFRRPDVFRTFPIAGQIPHSERVIGADFLGRASVDTLFAMSYECRGDTAILFRGKPPFHHPPLQWLKGWEGAIDTLRWAGEWRFSGFQESTTPLVFWIFKEGILGISGCFDSILALEYAEKMKKMALLGPDP